MTLKMFLTSTPCVKPLKFEYYKSMNYLKKDNSYSDLTDHNLVTITHKSNTTNL